MGKVVSSLLFLVCVLEGAAIIYWNVHLENMKNCAPPFDLEFAARNLSADVASSPSLQKEMHDTIESEGGDVLRILVRALLENTTNPSNESSWRVFETIGKFSNMKSIAVDSALSLGATQFLHLARNGPSPHVRRTAFALLAGAARREPARVELENSIGLLTKLVLEVLDKNETVSDVENAACILQQMTHQDSALTHLSSVGSVKRFVTLVASRDEGTVECAVWGLVSLSNNNWRECDDIIKLNGVPLLVSLLNADTYGERSIHGALATLNNIALGSESRLKRVLISKSVDPIVTLLRSPSVSLPTAKFAALALTTFSTFPIGCKALVVGKALTAALAFLTHTGFHSPSPDRLLAMQNLMQMIGNIALQKIFAKDLSSIGTTDALVSLSGDTQTIISQTAIWALNNVVVLDSSQLGHAVTLGVVPLAIKKIQIFDCELLKPAISVLHEISLKKNFRKYFKFEDADIVDKRAEACMGEAWVDWAIELQENIRNHFPNGPDRDSKFKKPK